MLAKDRFLWAIMGAIALLAALAVLLFLQRRGAQDYTSEDTPQGIVFNYVLALEKKDFQRAYSYLAEGEGKPSYERFRQDLLSFQSAASLQISQAQVYEQEAFVELLVIRGGGGPFSDVYREPANALLVRDASGNWKISNMPYPYWGWDWYNPQLIKPVPGD
jgi:hypothetical protein